MTAPCQSKTASSLPLRLSATGRESLWPRRTCIQSTSPIRSRFQRACARWEVHLARERIELVVRPGGELAHSMVARLSQRELEAVAQGPSGRRWVLLEGSFDGLDETFTEAANELRSRGFAVVVAHPERFPETPGTRVALEHELAAGSILQLTAWSFLGLCGEAASTAAWRLLLATPRAVIASDAHGCARPPALRLAVEALAGAGVLNPRRYATLMPRVLLENGLSAKDMALAA